jgi:hypothetical protein
MSIALDEAWFNRYAILIDALGEAYEMLEPLPETLVKKREEFEKSGYKKDISLLADRVDPAHYRQVRHDLEQLRTDIIAHERNDVVRRAYLDAISWVDANARLIIAGATGDETEYERANTELYDKPDEHVFKALCHWIRHTAKEALQTGSVGLKPLAERVLELVPDLHDNHRLLIPSESVFHAVKKSHQQKGGYYDMLFGPGNLPSAPYIHQIKGDDICRRVLQNISSDFSILTSENNIWAVMSSRKTLVRPSGYRLDREEFIGIVCHEIGSHILEEINGLKQPLRLLGKGLAGYDKGNEGRAFLREQIVYDSEHTFLEQFAWEYIALLHFSVSIAAGLHEKPFSFSELYNVLFAIYDFWFERRNPGDINNEASAHDEAWFLTVRILKGSTGNGGGYMKDSIYLEGNIRCWQHAAEDPSIILYGDQGKFDITNSDHLAIVRAVLSHK